MKYGTISLTRKINRHLTPSRGVFVLALDVEKRHIEITIEPEKFGSMLLDEDYAVECQVEMKPQDWTGWAIRKDGTQTGRWVSGEELAAFRRWQECFVEAVAAAGPPPKQPAGAGWTAGGFRCKQCGTVFLVSAKDKEGRPCVRGGHAICPVCACAWPVDNAVGYASPTRYAVLHPKRIVNE